MSVFADNRSIVVVIGSLPEKCVAAFDGAEPPSRRAMRAVGTEPFSALNTALEMGFGLGIAAADASPFFQF